jgi:hypothetical protein
MQAVPIAAEVGIVEPLLGRGDGDAVRKSEWVIPAVKITKKFH